MNKLKILELTNFSAGGCGVGARAKQEAAELVKLGHDVTLFSSNFVKGTRDIARKEDSFERVKITRFNAKKLGGESYMKWYFEQEAIKLRPDIIIAHAYRHRHTYKAIEIAKKVGAKVFLVTHAPFASSGSRSLIANMVVGFHDKFVGPRYLNNFDKILYISKWEIPYLQSLGVKKEKMVYSPNGIPDEFFKIKKAKSQNKILYFGRISPIKDIETLIRAFSIIKNKKAVLEIAGPSEEKYLQHLRGIANELKLGKRVVFSGAVYDIRGKIKKIDSANVYVLPSLREGMPQTLVEAMAREKIVIASKTPGAMDIINDGKNGYLFEIGSVKELARKLDIALDNKKNLGKQAKKSVEQFAWSEVGKKLDKVIRG